jgi:hypothetical protein
VAHIPVTVGVPISMTIGVSIGISVDGRWVRVATEVLSTLRSTVAHAPHATLFGVLHLSLVTLVAIMADDGQKVHEEAQHVQAVEECYRPLQYSGNIPNVLLGAHTKCDAKANLKQDKGELDPEGDAEDRVLAVVYSQALILPANEDCRNNVSEYEDSQEDVMQLVVSLSVENGKENEAHCTDNGCDCGARGVDFLPG